MLVALFGTLLVATVAEVPPGWIAATAKITFLSIGSVLTWLSHRYYVLPWLRSRMRSGCAISSRPAVAGLHWSPPQNS